MKVEKISQVSYLTLKWCKKSTNMNTNKYMYEYANSTVVVNHLFMSKSANMNTTSTDKCT